MSSNAKILCDSFEPEYLKVMGIDSLMKFVNNIDISILDQSPLQDEVITRFQCVFSVIIHQLEQFITLFDKESIDWKIKKSIESFESVLKSYTTGHTSISNHFNLPGPEQFLKVYNDQYDKAEKYCADRKEVDKKKMMEVEKDSESCSQRSKEVTEIMWSEVRTMLLCAKLLKRYKAHLKEMIWTHILGMYANFAELVEDRLTPEDNQKINSIKATYEPYSSKPIKFHCTFIPAKVPPKVSLPTSSQASTSDQGAVFKVPSPFIIPPLARAPREPKIIKQAVRRNQKKPPLPVQDLPAEEAGPSSSSSAPVSQLPYLPPYLPTTPGMLPNYAQLWSQLSTSGMFGNLGLGLLGSSPLPTPSSSSELPGSLPSSSTASTFSAYTPTFMNPQLPMPLFNQFSATFMNQQNTLLAQYQALLQQQTHTNN